MEDRVRERGKMREEKNGRLCLDERDTECQREGVQKKAGRGERVQRKVEGKKVEETAGEKGRKKTEERIQKKAKRERKGGFKRGIRARGCIGRLRERKLKRL